MFGFMVTADGGLTTAGYVITVIAGIILFFLAIYFAGKNSDKKKLTTRQLVFCAVAIAANYAQTECQFRYCGTAIPFLTVRSTAR